MTDDFTTAARAEAREATARYDKENGAQTPLAALLAHQRSFEAGAEWARDHLAAQEVTNEEVEATAKSLADDDGLDWTARTTPTGVYRAYARRALTAARTARRDEEKR